MDDFRRDLKSPGFPGGSNRKEPANNAEERGWIPASGRSPAEGHGYTPVFSPGKSHGQRSITGYSPWDHKESSMTE